MTINWFPGHMNRARREIAQSLATVRLVIEVLDARIPFSSGNPVIKTLLEDRPCITVLNKCDLADPAATDEWLTYLNARVGTRAIAFHRDAHETIQEIIALGHSLAPTLNGRKSVTGMILGIPNSGKSTLLNCLAGRKVAQTSNKPAVTKKQQRVKVRDGLWFLDTPGMLWPKLSPPDCGYRLALTGAIRDSVLDLEDIAYFAAHYLMEHYPAALAERYKLMMPPPNDEIELVRAIGLRTGCIGKGGLVSLGKAAQLFIRDIRQGALGPISFELPSID